MAAPRAAREEGSSAVVEVEGDRMVVVGGKRDVRMRAILGVWEVPPDIMTCSLCQKISRALREFAPHRHLECLAALFEPLPQSDD